MIDFYKHGDWNAVCFQCGRKKKASELKKHWQGYWVCPEHWEARHPQDFVRAVPDNMPPPWAQPAPVDIEVVLGVSTSIVGLAVVGYSVVGTLS